MQTYIIKSFKRTADGAIFERQLTGTNSGGYVFQQEVKRLNDFICDGTFIIWSVIKQVSVTRTQDNTVFTVGDRLSLQYGGSDIISKVIIKNSECVLCTGITTVASVDIRHAAKWLEPVVPISIPRPTRRTPTPGVIPTQTTSPFDEVERTIIERNPRAIRLERTLKRRRETLQEFLVKFFKEWNDDKNTIYVDDSSVQTDTGRRRSLGDIYMICKYYYPNCTLTEVLNLLYVILPTIITRGFRTSYCSTVNKRVWYYNSGYDNLQGSKTNNDEFGKQFRFYIDNLGA